MTIKKIEKEGGDYLEVKCLRCMRRGKPSFNIYIEKPTDLDIQKGQYRAEKHDRKGNHPVLFILSKPNARTAN